MPKQLLLRLLAQAAAALILFMPLSAFGLASNNIPLDSAAYTCLEKLAGFGYIDTEIHGLKPFSKAEAARLLLEAEANMDAAGDDVPELAREMAARLRELVPREADLRGREDLAPAFDYNPFASYRLRYVYLSGAPRSYERLVSDPGGEGIFGLGHVRLDFPKGHTLQGGGGEVTPLMENNEGIAYTAHHNFEMRLNSELFVTRYASALVEPLVISTPQDRDGSFPYADIRLNKGYLKLGGKGLELEVGRDANWFGQGFRGATVLTNNAANLDLVKLSSPEPVGWKWLRENIGLVKYSIFLSRLEESGSGLNMRRPWFIGLKLAVKPTDNFEIGGNFARQFGGPNLNVSGGIKGFIFGGEPNDGSNTLAGIDFRWRFPSLRGTTLYWEYMGEDNYGILPFVESFLFGVHIPRLTADGKNELRAEVFLGNRIGYADIQFPDGYTNGGAPMGHSQGGDTKDYFARFTHYFSARDWFALEYFHTQRGRLGRVGEQAVEEKDAGRVFYNMRLKGDWDLLASYGYESIRNADLVRDADRDNHLFRLDVSYRY